MTGLGHPLKLEYLKEKGTFKTFGQNSKEKGSLTFLNETQKTNITWVGSSFKVWILKRTGKFCKNSKRFYGLGHPLGFEYLKEKDLKYFRTKLTNNSWVRTPFRV